LTLCNGNVRCSEQRKFDQHLSQSACGLKAGRKGGEDDPRIRTADESLSNTGYCYDVADQLAVMMGSPKPGMLGQVAAKHALNQLENKTRRSIAISFSS
jgi:hypothetical protein